MPLAATSVDVVTYAQSWQWTDPARSVPEAMRVLRAGGALAIWWNTTAFDVPWIREQHDRIASHCGVAAKPAVPLSDSEAVRLAGLTGLRVTRRRLRWSRTVSLDVHLANIGSCSALLVFDGASRRAFLDDERRRLQRAFPRHELDEVYVADLVVALRP
jgi:hypothetical protein